MRQTMQLFLIVPLMVIALLSTSREAHAQPYNCSQTTTCGNWNMTSGAGIAGQFSSNGAPAGALNAFDTSTGVGLMGTTTGKGTGVLGSSKNTAFTAPAGSYGVYGYSADTTGGVGGDIVKCCGS
jgi:hypothetical protein